jgi:uncharacterized phage protein (TIGR01671 family)
MREIKFRYTTVRLNGYIFHHDFVLKQIESPDIDRFVRVNHIGDTDKMYRRQFSGLLDKNGREIYEGDIVKVYRKDSFSLFNKGIIAYSDCYGGFLVQYTKSASPNGILYQESIHSDDGITIFDRASYWKLKVIGNIYENPELLK